MGGPLPYSMPAAKCPQTKLSWTATSSNIQGNGGECCIPRLATCTLHHDSPGTSRRNRCFPGVKEGESPTSIPYLNVHRYDGHEVLMPSTSEPFLFIIVQGVLRLHLANEISEFKAGGHFVSSIDTPVAGESVRDASTSAFVAVSLNFSVADVVGVILDIEQDSRGEPVPMNVDALRQQLDVERMSGLVLRLLRMRDQPAQLAFMAKHLKREVIFNILLSSDGERLIRHVTNIQEPGEIYAINSWIKQNFKASFSVQDLADKSQMSVSRFHQKFKSAVGMGPLQCQKQLRLTESRRLMLDKGMTVTEAALEIGYESLSQFIRDYRKAYGRAPQKDIQELRSILNKSGRTG